MTRHTRAFVAMAITLIFTSLILFALGASSTLAIPVVVLATVAAYYLAEVRSAKLHRPEGEVDDSTRGWRGWSVPSRAATSSGGPFLSSDEEAKSVGTKSPAATEGSDYYVPTPAEIGSKLKEQIADRQLRDALTLASDLVRQYCKNLEDGTATEYTQILKHELAEQYSVRTLAEKILKTRGWSISADSEKVFIGPLDWNRDVIVSDVQSTSIESSVNMRDLIERNIVKPRTALSLSLAKELVDGYKAKLSGEVTTEYLTVEISQEIPYNVFTLVQDILAPRGWSVSHDKDKKYTVSPSEPRARAYRGGGMIF